MLRSTDRRPNRPFRTNPLLALATIVALSTGVFAQETRPIQANDLYRIRSASDVSLSPDGRRVAFAVTQIDSADNTYYSHLWVGSVDEREVRQYTRGKVRDRDPVWSPDGSQLAFVSSRGEDAAQIHILPVDGGEARQLTDLEAGAFDPVWAPDGASLLFRANLPDHHLDGSEAAPGDTAMFGSMKAIRNWLGGNARAEEPAVITRLNFQGERGLQPIEEWTHIYHIDLPDGQPERITSGPFDYSSPSFSPDGERIVLTARIDREVHTDYVVKSDLYVMNVDGSNMTRIPIPTHSVFSARWSPRGADIAFLARDTSEITALNTELGLVRVDDRDGTVRWLSRQLDRSVRRFRWADDGRSIHFNAAVHGTVPVYRVELENGQARQMVSGERGVLDFDLARDRLALVITEPANPSEVYVAEADGGDESRITNLNAGWLADVQIQPHVGFRFRSFDGRQVQAWTLRPVGYEDGTRYPLALEIHGGPHAMWGPGETTMWHEFQLLAANGYMVLYTNPRGSDGYGNEFKLAIQRDWGDGPMRDVLTAVDTVVGRGRVNPDRMVVTGGSYAGYLTAYLVGHDHRFKAAVAQRGVYDLSVFFGEGNAWRLVPYEFDAYPWEDPDIMREESPITYAHDIRTPLLIMHSDRDLRTGVSQSEMLYRTLRVLKRPVEYVRYPREGHDLSRTGEPLLRVDRLLRILEFFDRHLPQPAKTSAPESP